MDFFTLLLVIIFIVLWGHWLIFLSGTLNQGSSIHNSKATCNLQNPFVWLFIQLSKFSFCFWCWFWRRTMTTADGTHWSSIFDIQVSCLQHPIKIMWDYLDVITYTQQLVNMFGTSYYCEQNEACQDYTAFTTLKSSLVWSALSVNLFLVLQVFVISNNFRCLINKLWLLPCEFSCFFFFFLTFYDCCPRPSWGALWALAWKVWVTLCLKSSYLGYFNPGKLGSYTLTLWSDPIVVFGFIRH